MIEEVWKPVNVKNFEGLYEVSNLGRIKSLERNLTDSRGRNMTYKPKIRKLVKERKGYLTIKLNNEPHHRTMKVHRLVAFAFIENPENKPQINHKDGNKTNNEINNLEWVTNHENALHGYSNGLFDKANELKKINLLGNNHSGKEIAVIDKRDGKKSIFESAKEAGSKFGYSRAYFTSLINKYNGENKKFKAQYTNL